MRILPSSAAARGFLVCLSLGLGACRERIQHGLDERQANALQTVLIEQGLDARKVAEEGKRPTWSIDVRRAQATEAVRVLAALGLPRPAGEVGCPAFGDGALVRTPLEEQVCRVQVLERSIERTLQEMEGVLVARVHLALPPPLRPGQPAPAAKASVLLRVSSPHAEALRAARESLCALVAGGVEGLAPQAVALHLDEVRLHPPAAAPKGASPPREGGLLAALGLVLAGVAGVGARSGWRRYRAGRLAPATPAPSPVRPVVGASASRRAA